MAIARLAFIFYPRLSWRAGWFISSPILAIYINIFRKKPAQWDMHSLLISVYKLSIPIWYNQIGLEVIT
jgi:hypothetical protein